MIIRTDKKFKLEEINPFSNRKYDESWVYIEITDTDKFSILDKTEYGLFQVYVSKKCFDWEWRLMDFIGYESDYNKNIIIKISDEDYSLAENMYQGHSYKDSFIRAYEPKVLIHSTTKDIYESILNMGKLMSWNRLKIKGIITEQEPIGFLLGDHKEYRDYIMFSEGGVGSEIVVNSKQHNEIIMDINSEYEPGARLYFATEEIAKDGKLIRDGLHYKVKNELDLKRNIIWVATTSNVSVESGVYTPLNFANAADEQFRNHKIAKRKI